MWIRKKPLRSDLQILYRYEVHGGLRARQSLLAENPSQVELSTIHAVVYTGLTDEEALRLALRHNINGHYNHKMTHRDYVSVLILKKAIV